MDEISALDARIKKLESRVPQGFSGFLTTALKNVVVGAFGALCVMFVVYFGVNTSRLSVRDE